MENMQERIREGFQSAQPPAAPQRTNGGTVDHGVQQVPQPAAEQHIDNAPPPRPAETWPVRVKLIYRPIRGNNGEELRELVFREPTGGDINRCGNPCRIDQGGDVIIDEKKMHLIMANLSGVLSPLLDAMHPRDWNSCAYRLRNFFLPDLEAW